MNKATHLVISNFFFDFLYEFKVLTGEKLIFTYIRESFFFASATELVSNKSF
jgi:hypothetical protein